MKRSVPRKKRSALRKPPEQAKAEAPQSSSFMSCFVGESQSTKVSAVQTHLLGDNCFCPKSSCPGIVHVVEMDRVLTAPCSDIPLYSMETRRMVKCKKCFYVNSLTAHKLISQRGNGRLPIVKLHRAAISTTKTTQNNYATPTTITTKLASQRDQWSGNDKIHMNNDRKMIRTKPQMGVLTETSVNSVTLDTAMRDTETPRSSNITGNKCSQQPTAQIEEDEEGIITRLLRKMTSFGSGPWEDHKGNATANTGDAHGGDQQQQQQQLEEQQPQHIPVEDETHPGPPKWLVVNGDGTEVSALHSIPQSRQNISPRKGKVSSPIRHRKDPPNFDETTNGDAPSRDDEMGEEQPVPLSTRISFDRLRPPERHTAGETSDLIKYIANRAANADSNVAKIPLPEDSCHDPPMNDPPYYYHNNSRTIRQEPKGSRYRQPKGRKKVRAPSLSSRLENPNRRQNDTRYPSPTTRQRQRPGCDDQIRQVREDAPAHDDVVPKRNKTPRYDGREYQDEDDSDSPEIM